MELIHQCLRNVLAHRPETTALLERVIAILPVLYPNYLPTIFNVVINILLKSTPMAQLACTEGIVWVHVATLLEVGSMVITDHFPLAVIFHMPNTRRETDAKPYIDVTRLSLLLSSTWRSIALLTLPAPVVPKLRYQHNYKFWVVFHIASSIAKKQVVLLTGRQHIISLYKQTAICQSILAFSVVQVVESIVHLSLLKALPADSASIFNVSMQLSGLPVR